jgi:hypothetical protein
MDQRLAILNGFGRTLGDSIIGLQALRAARSLGLLARDVVLFRLVTQSPVIEDVYALATGLADIRELPWDHATPDRPFPPAAAFAETIDMRDFAFDPAFHGVAMIDYFLRRLGIDPETVPPACRRNTWLAPLVPPPARQGYVLLCPKTANPMRDMPDWVQALLQTRLAERGLEVRSQATLSPARTLPELCALVGGARLIVSADTAMVHLADAMATPCLAFFTTHDPAWRVRDYPLCQPVHLRPATLPPALEFPRDAADIAAAQAAWENFGAIALQAALARFLA